MASPSSGGLSQRFVYSSEFTVALGLPLAAPPEVRVLGTVIGTYRLLQKLGEGGMGTVWVAEHTLLGRRAAIKLIHSTYSRNEALVQRFFNEAKAVAAIADPGIVQVFDFGIHSDESPYIVMELLDGETLETRLHRVGRLAPGEAIRLVRQVAMSLSAAHDKGVIHRDLKPENLFAARDSAMPGGERVKVLDFGIAKLSHGAGKHKTQTGMVLGTPAYMSPEQCRGLGNIDHHSDIYSLGAVLFCLVTGRPPFEGEGESDAMISHVRDQPPVPSSIASGVPAGLDSVILRCLEKDPARRYQAMGELVAALDIVEAGPRVRAASAGIEGWPATPDMPGAPVTTMLLPHANTTISDAPGEVAFRRRAAAGGARAIRQARSGRVVAFAGFGVVAVGGMIAIAVTRGDGSDPASLEPVPGSSPAPAVAVELVPAAASPPAPAVAVKPTLASAPEEHDPAAEVAARTRDVLTRLVAWSRDHRGAPCPDIAVLGDSARDPWGRVFRLTCADQPGDQIIGAISAGPDGTPGTSDDIASWKLGRDVTDLVRGSRWGATVPPASPPANLQPGLSADAKRKPVRATTKPVEAKPPDTPKPVEAKLPDAPKPKQDPRSDGIELDEFGIPIKRKR